MVDVDDAGNFNDLVVLDGKIAFLSLFIAGLSVPSGTYTEVTS